MYFNMQLQPPPVADHCCSVGRVNFEVNVPPVMMMQRLQRAINMHLQAQRKKQQFVPTEEQMKHYHSHKQQTKH
jgi:hypothetical protein